MVEILFYTGGFDLLGRTKDQIRSLQQVNDAKAACQALKLDGLVLVGGKLVLSTFESDFWEHHLCELDVIIGTLAMLYLIVRFPISQAVAQTQTLHSWQKPLLHPDVILRCILFSSTLNCF